MKTQQSRGGPILRTDNASVSPKSDAGLFSSVESEEILVAIVIHVKVTEELEHPGVREREN